MTAPANDPLEVKKAPQKIRLTKFSIPWLPMLGFPIWYELEMIRRGEMGGPLSHIFWWAYGDRFTLRWWMLACTVAGFFLWTAVHFAFVTPGLRALLIMLGVGALVGVTGWLFTR